MHNFSLLAICYILVLTFTAMPTDTDLTFPTITRTTAPHKPRCVEHTFLTVTAFVPITGNGRRHHQERR